MQSHSSVVNGACAENGALTLKEAPTTSKTNSFSNGDCNEVELNPSKINSADDLSDSNKEVVRLVGQHLRSMGLQWV